MVIRENEIFSRVTDVVKQSLDALGISGFEVLQVSQPMATSDHACVLVSRIGIHRYGWQGITYDPGSDFVGDGWRKTDGGAAYMPPSGATTTLKENWNYIDEATFQVSAFLPRTVRDARQTLTSYDAVSAMATWMMSRMGVQAMIERGFQPLRVSEVRTPTQQDDSNTPQFNPNFDLRFFVRQQSGTKVPMVDALKAGRHLF